MDPMHRFPQAGSPRLLFGPSTRGWLAPWGPIGYARKTRPFLSDT